MVTGIIAGCSSAIGMASKFTLWRIGIQVRPKLLCLAEIRIKFEHTLHVGARLRGLARDTELNGEIDTEGGKTFFLTSPLIGQLSSFGIGRFGANWCQLTPVINGAALRFWYELLVDIQPVEAREWRSCTWD